MTGDFWLGLLLLPGLALVAAILAGMFLWGCAMWGWLAPKHWRIGGPQLRSRPAHEVFRYVNVSGGHARTLRKVLRVGPWSLLLIRYAPGNVEDREPDLLP